MSLASLATGACGRVTQIHPSCRLAHRLMEMGLVEGARVQLVRRAPLGDPLQIRLGDYQLSIRTADADLIGVSAE